jgi:hypothetical protein
VAGITRNNKTRMRMERSVFMMNSLDESSHG